MSTRNAETITELVKSAPSRFASFKPQSTNTIPIQPAKTIVENRNIVSPNSDSYRNNLRMATATTIKVRITVAYWSKPTHL